MNDNKQITITNDIKQDGRMALGKQISDIRNARESVQEQNSILNSNITSLAGGKNADILKSEIDNLVKLLLEVNKVTNENLKSKNAEIKANADNVKALLTSTNIAKDAKKAFEVYNKAMSDYNKAMEDGTMTWEKAFELEEAFTDLQETVPSLTRAVKTIKDNVDDCSDAVKEQTRAIITNKNNRVQENRDAIRKRKEKQEVDIKTGSQSLPKAYKEELSKLNTEIRGLFNTLNINKLANELAPTSRQKIQQDLQTNFNLTSSEFESFKKDLYGQINTSLYTDEEIKAAMQTLNTTALGSTKTATAYFKDIITGQKVLGMSMETQQSLLKLGNITGRNELTFYQNQVAKYLNSSLGLNKKQLDELVSMNSSLTMQAADIGIATEAFSETSLREMAAFESTNTGGGSLYNHLMQRALTDDTFANLVLGTSVSDLSRRQANGEGMLDLVRNSTGSAREILNVLSSGDIEAIRNMRQYAAQELGIDDQTWSAFRMIAQQSKELNKNLTTATGASQQDAAEALKSLEEKEFDSITGIQQTVNYWQNFFEKEFSWKLLSEISNIGVLLTTLISVVSISSSLNELLGGKTGLLGKLGGTKLGGSLKGLFTGTGTASKFAKFGAGAVGIGMMGMDAMSMYNASGNPLDLARGALMGTGNAQQSTGEKLGSIAGNALKGAAIGAMVGHPLIGAAIGGALGLVGSLFSKSTKEELTAEEKIAKKNEEYFKAIKENTYATSVNTAKSGIGIVYRYRGTSNYSQYGDAMGGPAGGSYGVTSSYGYRPSFKTDNGTWTKPFHSGTDFGAPEGTPLYSNVTGTVLAAGKDSAGANYVGVTDAKGYTHWYWHMMQPATVKAGDQVRQGQLVGYVGHTGNAKGNHLHYMVTKPGRNDWWNAQESTVDPLPFATSSIFDGGTSTLPTYTSDLQETVGLRTTRTAKVTSSDLGDIATPIVNSIGDLKQTIINLSQQTERNKKIMEALVNRNMQSPTV